MSAIDEVTREKWIMNTFPEWGTWLNEDMEAAKPAPGTVEMWWLGCTGIYMKTPGNTAITIDLWTGNVKRTHGDGKMKVGLNEEELERMRQRKVVRMADKVQHVIKRSK